MNYLFRIKRHYASWRVRRKTIRNIRKDGSISKSTKLVLLGRFSFGRRLVVASEGIDNYSRSQIIVLQHASLEIGDDVGMTQVSIICKASIRIGNNVKIGAGTMIFDTNFHNTDWRVRRNHEDDLNTATCAPVLIGDDVFIGARCIINKGVTIGDRSVVAAGSVVVKDIPSDSVAGGNPCKIIRHID